MLSDDAQWSPRDSDAEIGEVLISAHDLAQRIKDLGDRITADLHGTQPLFIGVLKGAFIFLADLVRVVDLPLEIDFMAVSSYGASTTSTGVVRIVKDLDVPLDGRHVILVEDIVDSGLTLEFLVRNLEARGPASLSVCTLLKRADLDLSGTHVGQRLRYVGVELSPDWVVGYGLDAGQRNRHLPALHRYLPPVGPTTTAAAPAQASVGTGTGTGGSGTGGSGTGGSGTGSGSDR